MLTGKKGEWFADIKTLTWDTFKLWCWKRLLRVPWTAKRSNQSILKEISPEYSLEGLMLKLKLQYFGHLMQTVDSLEKTLILGKIKGKRRSGWQRMRWLIVSPTQRTWIWANSGKSWRTEELGMLPSMQSQAPFSYSSVNENLGCFHILATVKSAAMNTKMHTFLSY